MSNKILENLEVLRAAVAAEPTELFDLQAYQRETDCGTLHCTLGLACTMPYFNEQGLRFDTCDIPVMDENFGNIIIHNFDILFGEGSYGKLFTSAGYGMCDEQLGYVWSYDPDNLQNMTDKELALKRLDAEIDRHKGGAE